MLTNALKEGKKNGQKPPNLKRTKQILEKLIFNDITRHHVLNT